MHTNYYKIVELLKSFQIVAPTCFGLHKPSSGNSQPVLIQSYNVDFDYIYRYMSRSQWPRGLRRRSMAARLLRWWVRIPPGTWMSVCCECSMLSGRGLCDELITRPEES